MKTNENNFDTIELASDKQLNDTLTLILCVAPASSIKAFIARIISDPSALERTMFHLCEPLRYTIDKRDSLGDEEKVEVVLLHRSVFPEWEKLLKEARARGGSETIMEMIDHKLMEILGDNMGEVSCGHTFDCCGCWFTRGYQVKFRGNLIRIKRYWYRNY